LASSLAPPLASAPAAVGLAPAPLKLGGAPVKLGGFKAGGKLGGKRLGGGGGGGGSGAGGSAAAFVVDDGPKMGPLVAIDYSEEEKAAVVPAAVPLSADELKALVASIPTQRDELYAAEVRWDVVAKAGLVEAKLKPFINKKMVEYLGEEEPGLVTHIADKLGQNIAAAAVEEALAAVLDEDAEVFVVKLWRMLLFEIRSYLASHPTEK